MKNKDLIAKLQQLPQDMDIVIWDVDFEYHLAGIVKKVKIESEYDAGYLTNDIPDAVGREFIVIAGWVYEDHK